MKSILSLFVVLLVTAPPLYAEQALVLTEIEQAQEKIWYLQRDLASQKAALETQQQQLTTLAAELEGQQRNLETRLAAMTQMLAGQEELVTQLTGTLQSLKEAFTALNNEFDQQNAAQLQQAEKSGTQEGLLKALRQEFAEHQSRTDQALAATRQQLADVRSQLDALQKDAGKGVDQIGLYLGGAALAMTILLTIGLAFLNSKSNRRAHERHNMTRHEL